MLVSTLLDLMRGSLETMRSVLGDLTITIALPIYYRLFIVLYSNYFTFTILIYLNVYHLQSSAPKRIHLHPGHP